MANKDVPVEYLLATDEFNNPMELKGQDAISKLFINLILLEPGTYSSRPGMGVGLISNYRYGDEADVERLQREIRKQIDIYLPEFVGVTVKCSLVGTSLRIDIVHDDILYQFETVVQNNKITLVELT